MSAEEKLNGNSILKGLSEYIQMSLDEIMLSRSKSDNDFLLGQTYAYIDCLEYMGKRLKDETSMYELEFKYDLK